MNEEEEISESNMSSIDCDKDLLEIDRKIVHLVKSAIFKSKNLKSNFTQIPSSILELASNKLSLTAEAFGHVAVDSEGNVTWVVSTFRSIILYFLFDHIIHEQIVVITLIYQLQFLLSRIPTILTKIRESNLDPKW